MTEGQPAVEVAEVVKSPFEELVEKYEPLRKPLEQEISALSNELDDLTTSLHELVSSVKGELPVNQQRKLQEGGAKVMADRIQAIRDKISTLRESLKAIPKPIDLNTDEMTAKFLSAEIYRKGAVVFAEQATGAIQVNTTLENGLSEAENTTEPGDWIVTNPGGEKYILKPKKFASRYEPTETPGKYKARGIARAISNPVDGMIATIAPWGGEMLGDKDALLLAVFEPEKPDEVSNDRYFIGGKEFKDTYTEKYEQPKV